jgi:putative transposase
MPLHSKFGPQNTPSGHFHHRQSIRLKEYDYTLSGAYFVTIVTHQRDCLLGDIQNGTMVLNAFGQIADECWRFIPEHFPSVELGAYVIMPNHMHGIIIISGVEARHADNGDGEGASVGARHADDGKGAALLRPNVTRPNVKPGSLGAIVRSYKSAVSYRIHKEHTATSIWQRNYYEHIIRNDRDLQRITDYINANPLRWNDDDENPRNV